MGNQVVYDKFTWVIKNFSSLVSDTFYSDPFKICGYIWLLTAKKHDDCLSLFLEVVDDEALLHEWRIHAQFLLTVVNQTCQKTSIQKGITHWFSQMDPRFGHHLMCSVSELLAKDSGFLRNGELEIVVEVNLLQVVGRVYVSEVSQGPTQTIWAEHGVMESNTIDIDGFQLLPSQVEFVKRIFEKRRDVELVFRSKNQHLRKACMYVLVSLMETLCKSLEELSNDDLVEADCSLAYLIHSGFKVDWLGKKLEEVKEKKKDEQIGVTRMQELEEELKDLKEKCLDKEALLEKERAKVLAARASTLMLHDLA